MASTVNASSSGGPVFKRRVTGFETKYRRYVKIPEDSRSFNPVKIKPDDIVADIQNLKDKEHERSEQKKIFAESMRYATRLLAQARSCNIRYLPDEIPVKTLDEFISNPTKLDEFILDLENLRNDYVNPKKTEIMNKAEEVTEDLEDPNIEIAQRLLGKAKFNKVKDIPDEIPTDEKDLKKFIKSLQKAIRKHKEAKEEK
ncbi:hypothetical protein LCGC14_2845330, partial [marine sediment metagenome]